MLHTVPTGPGRAVSCGPLPALPGFGLPASSRESRRPTFGQMPSPHAPPEGSAASRQTRDILVVDDDRAWRERLRLALALGWPRHARLVGYALARCPDDIPAHRVVNHRGEASRAWAGGHPEVQRALLRAEGVTFTRDGRVDLRRHICDLVALMEE